jgi:hypothetical protein
MPANMKVLYPPLALQTPKLFRVEYYAQIMDFMERGMRYGDAKILWCAESCECSTLVTWNTRHYQDKT